MKTAEDYAKEAMIIDATSNDIQKVRAETAKLFEAYAEQFKPKWIPVEERLPEPESKSLVLANKGVVFLMYYGLSNNGENVWWHHDEQVRPYLMPTHWQPLPPNQ